MANAITVPRLGWSMEEGTFIEWRKQDGEQVRPGNALFVLESDKAAEVIEAIDAGTLRIGPEGPQPGDKVKVGQVLAYLVAEGEEEPHAKAQRRKEEEKEGEVGRSTSPSLGVLAPLREAPQAVRRHRPAASPRARRVAAELGVDWRVLQGSGRTGRIRERDVRAAAQAGSEGRTIPHTAVRRVIAGRMLAAVTQAAPVTLTTKADATNLVNLRGQFKAAATGDEIPTYTDLLVKLAAVALSQHDEVKAQWRDEGLFIPRQVDIAVAVDTEAGLFAPVIRGADRLTLRQVAKQARELIALARAGRLGAEQMRDATFTLTNLGMFGVDAFTPLLQLPQSAILGVGRIVREAAVVNDAVVPRDQLTLSLTFDHRVIDGAPAARFLATLKRCVEQPAAWLVP